MSLQFLFASMGVAFGGTIACTVLFTLATSPLAPLGFRVRTTSAFPPILGGFAILAATLLAAWMLGVAGPMRHLLLAMCFIFAAGLWCDLTMQRAPALAAQAFATLLAAAAAGLQLQSLGVIDVTFGGLGLALAVVGVLVVSHAINGMGDLPGFRAAFAFISLTWFAFAAAMTGLDAQFKVAVLLQGAVGGYIICNFVLLRRPYRHVFLGSAGGLMLGFALGWLAMDITQGPQRTFPCFAAFWILFLPIADWVSVVLRQIAARKDLLERSDRHLHHYLKAKGLKTAAVFSLLVAVTGLFALFGFVGWRRDLPPGLMYGLALVLFVAYHVWITRAWRRVAGFTVFTV